MKSGNLENQNANAELRNDFFILHSHSSFLNFRGRGANA